MGAFSREYCNFTPRNVGIVGVSFGDPKNKFERALNNEPNQTIQGYRVKILQSGFTSKARKSNGKTVLTLKTLKG